MNRDADPNNKPLIGVAPGYFPKENAWWLMGKESYTHSIWDTGGIPVLLTHPNSTGKVEEFTSKIDALVLTGGPDLPIEYYGGSSYDLNGEEPMHANRVAFDRQVFEAFRDEGKPVLAICAGHQHINVVHGGGLWEDVPSQMPGALDHGDYKGPVVNHTVEVDKNSLVYDILRDTAPTVNSTHHQGIKTLGTGLKATAWSADGLVEAMEPENGKAKFVAVQWHPEQMQKDEKQMALFRWLVEEAGN